MADVSPCALLDEYDALLAFHSEIPSAKTWERIVLTRTIYIYNGKVKRYYAVDPKNFEQSKCVLWQCGLMKFAKVLGASLNSKKQKCVFISRALSFCFTMIIQICIHLRKVRELISVSQYRTYFDRICKKKYLRNHRNENLISITYVPLRYICTFSLKSLLLRFACNF